MNKRQLATKIQGFYYELGSKMARVLSLAATFIIVISFVLTRYQHTSPARLPDNWKGEGVKTNSLVNEIDDQMDILRGALDYINTKPKYKSKYYNGGYPNDDYGVCTDVVAFAMKANGYNLMEMVSKDIKVHQSDYGIKQPDINIDFRRVRNIYVFFKNNAEELTTDILNINKWQGGDIVIFKNHIGVVSDRRNKNGIPYVIHHSNPFQKNYEQDILESRHDIIGHYRWTDAKNKVQ